jgi:signal transduction histidine kinase
MKITIVEDDADSRVMLSALLKGQGHITVEADSGIQALELIKNSPPDLIITDILMPGMDGFDFCREVKSDPKLTHIPLIFYTATYSSEEDEELGIMMGASRYIIKPQQPKVLIKIIDELFKELNHEKLQSPEIITENQEIINRKQIEVVGKKLQKKMMDLQTSKNKEKYLSNKLGQLANQFQNINETLSYITTAASHDLIEPIRKISSFSDRLHEVFGSNLDERQQVYLSVIEKSSRKMKRCIEDLGTFSRVTNAEIVLEEVRLKEIFDSIFKDLTLKIKSSKAECKIENLVALNSDRKLLIELFKNIILNCLMFKNEDEPLSIHISCQKTEDGFVMVSVKDSGIGFDDKYVDRIFKPFQKLNRQDKGESSGMGLAICQKIVARLQGDISAKSSIGSGATFLVKLPLKPTAIGLG